MKNRKKRKRRVCAQEVKERKNKCKLADEPLFKHFSENWEKKLLVEDA